MEFELLKQLVDELNSSNSTLDKINVLSLEKYNNDFIKKVLVATYNPFAKYYVTSANLRKNSNLVTSNNYDLFELLDLLDKRKITGHEAISVINGFIQNHEEYKELIYNIFDRNLKTRTSESIINKVHEDLIPTFDVCLAKKYEDHQKKVDFDKDRWLASRKLDGLRCIGLIDHAGNIEMRSRTGNLFTTLQLVIDELSKLNLTGVVFDGEICIVDENGNEDFSAIQKEYNRKDYTIPNPRYKIFDMINYDDFMVKKGNELLYDRLHKLIGVMDSVDSNILSYVDQILVKDDLHLEEMRTLASEDGWEGIMIRKNIGYEGKRSDKLLKCKLFEDAEYRVKDVVMGEIRVIVDQKEVTETMLSKVIIEHKGFEVGVGSGFSIDERREYYLHPENIIGKQITVQYFEESKDKDGNLSLRFPTVKFIYKDGDRNT